MKTNELEPHTPQYKCNSNIMLGRKYPIRIHTACYHFYIVQKENKFSKQGDYMLKNG